MWHLVVDALVHLSILLLALFCLWRLNHYTAKRFNQFGVHSPTKLAVEGQYEAPPQGQVVLYLVIRLIVPRLIVITAVIGSFLILLYDFEFRSTICSWFNKLGWEWKLPVAFVIGVAINLVVTVERLRSGRLREAAMKDLEHSHALRLLVGAEALQVLCHSDTLSLSCPCSVFHNRFLKYSSA
jgi:hypothetical protein